MVLIPIIGMIVYFILRPRDAEVKPDPRSRYEAVLEEGLSDSALDQLSKLGDLRDSGALTEEEFQSMKAKLLA